jgi:hypothetical protein
MGDVEVTYLCGCLGSEVGQSFDHGLLVCPQHREPVAPFERPERHARARVTLVLDLECHTPEQALRWSDALVATLDHDATVTAIVSSLEHLEPAWTGAKL